MMGNYKNLKFSNTLAGFKDWVKEFPPLSPEDVKAQGFKKEGDIYLELQLVRGFLGSDGFVAANIREYDHESKNFEYVGMEKEKELTEGLFKNKIESFRAKHLK
jgi:hypothetical protein